MKHLRLFENTEKANNQVVDLPVVALVQGVEKGLVMAPKTEEASEATIKVSESGDITIEPKGGSDKVKITYHQLGGTVETNKIGSGELYNLIDSLYVDGELFDIDDLIVVGGQGSGVGYIALPETFSGEHVVEFDLGESMFEEKRHIINGGVSNCTVNSIPEINTVTYHANGATFVDLGLPSGKLWATMNIGATSETDSGHYYMWASTTPNDNDVCDWVNTPYCTNPSEPWFNPSAWEKYIEEDDELDLTDDVARITMGGSWRMPSKNEFDELIDNTNSEWVTNYNNSGIDGRVFRSTSDMNKFIFIPAYGCREKSSLKYVGVYCFLWSRSLSALVNDAQLSSFDSRYTDMSALVRCDGVPVRGLL